MALNQHLFICILLVVFTTSSTARNDELLFSHPKSAPPSDIDEGDKTPICFNMVSSSMLNCLDYLSDDTVEEPKPNGSCCSGVEYVLKTDEDCFCLALKAIGGYGLQLNNSKLAGLSTVCQIAAPPLYKICELFKAPVVATAPAPRNLIRAPAHAPISSLPAPIESPVESPVESPTESPYKSPSTPDAQAPGRSFNPHSPTTTPPSASNNEGEAPSATTVPIKTPSSSPSGSSASTSSNKKSAASATASITTLLIVLAPLTAFLMM